MTEIIADKSAGRIIAGLLGSILFVVTGAWIAGWFGEPLQSRDGLAADLAYFFGTDQAMIGKIIGWACMLLFAAFALVHVKLLFSSGPVVRIDKEGMWVARWRKPAVPWHHIERLTQISGPGGRLFGLVLTEKGRAALGFKQRSFNQPDLVLNLVGTKAKFDSVYDYVQRHHPRLLQI